MPKPYPIYNESKPATPGMYLGLFHGRKTPTESLSDWGSNGPIIGPLDWAHTTYFGHFRIRLTNSQDRFIYGFDHDEPEFVIGKEGLVEFDGVFYGDWTVFHHKG